MANRCAYNACVEPGWQQAEAAEDPGFTAAVQTHPDAAYRHMVDVLDTLQAAGATRIALKALGEQER